MGKIIVITFAFLSFAFYELSDGDEFIPIADEKRASLEIERAEEAKVLAAAKAERLKSQPQAEPVAEIVLASAVMITPKHEPKNDDALAAATEALDADKVESIVAQAAPADVREVTAPRVNMRNGPGQKFNVVAKLTSGEQVEILQDPGDGWVKLRVTDSGRVGWMADFLLTASNN